MTEIYIMPGNVAIFVDGDNLHSRHAAEILTLGQSLGSLGLVRVYGGETALPHWADQPAFQFVFSGTGKNAADLHLAIDAVDFTARHTVRHVLLCSSDGDFFHLARHLREKGLEVTGFGDKTKVTDRFKAACSAFQFASPPQISPCTTENGQAANSLDQKIKDAIATNSQNGQGIALVDLAAIMYKKHSVRISHQPERTWRAYLGKRTSMYNLDPRGPKARVRFIPSGF